MDVRKKPAQLSLPPPSEHSFRIVATYINHKKALQRDHVLRTYEQCSRAEVAIADKLGRWN
jgi:hypothetical protein